MKDVASILYRNAMKSGGAKLVFCESIIKNNIEFLDGLQKEYGINFLVSLKALPNRKTIDYFKHSSVGYEAANFNESDILPLKTSKFLWFNFPYFSPEDFKRIDQEFRKYIISINFLPTKLSLLRTDCDYSIRLNTNFLDSHNKSRFGIDIQDLENTEIIKSLIKGLHFHHGSEKNLIKDYELMFKKALAIIERFQLKKVEHINLGGGLHALSNSEIVKLCQFIKLECPKGIKVYFEPGQYFFKSSGYLSTTILEKKKYKDGVALMVSASKLCHLNWSEPKLLINKTDEELNINTYIFGPTCYEDDYIGKFTLSKKQFNQGFRINDPILFSNISSYSAALNRSFNGIPKADILII